METLINSKQLLGSPWKSTWRQCNGTGDTHCPTEQAQKTSILCQKAHRIPEYYAFTVKVATTLLVISHGGHDGFICERELAV